MACARLACRLSRFEVFDCSQLFHGRRKRAERGGQQTVDPAYPATAQAVNVKLLPVPQSTSFSGISLPARSMKFCPLQCIGIT